MDFKQEPFESAYEVCDEVGSGQFAVVHMCKQRSTHDKFAAKCIQKTGALSSSLSGVPIETIRNEVSILQLLHHEHVVKLFEVYESLSTVTLVLEFVEGSELFAFLAEKDRLDEEEASGFVRQILAGVAYLHDNLVVHLDLKPENIMLEHCDEMCAMKREPRIKIIDFGLAKRCQANRSISVEPHGTPEFISPEVLACDPVWLSADMWTIGVIIYIMLVGSSPFSAANDAAVFRKILAAQYSFENNLSEQAKDLIQSLLVRNPAKRLTAVQALLHAWVTPFSAELSRHRKRSVITREHLQKLKKYVKAKQRWKKTVELISVVNHFSQMASYKRSNSYSELEHFSSAHSAPASNAQLPLVTLTASAHKHTGASENAAVASVSGRSTPTGQASGTFVRQLKPVTPGSRSLSGAGLSGTAQHRIAANDALANQRSLLKPVSRSKKYS